MDLWFRLNGPAFNTMDFSKFAKEYIDRGHHPCEHPFQPPRKQRKPSLDPNGDEENTHFASTFSALYNIWRSIWTFAWIKLQLQLSKVIYSTLELSKASSVVSWHYLQNTTSPYWVFDWDGFAMAVDWTWTALHTIN
mgnify:CR=1 FL=1